MNKRIFLLVILFLAFFSHNTIASMDPTSTVIDEKQDYDIEIQLVKGWNIIVGTPLFGNEKNSIAPNSDIKVADIKAAFYFSRKDNKYLQIYPESKEIEEYLIKYREDKNEMNYFMQSSNWIYSEKAGVLRYYQRSFDIQQQLKITFIAWWNLITISPEYSSKTFKDIKGNCDAEKLFFYVGELDRWLTFDLNNTLFGTLDIGKGFVVKIKNDCSLDAKSLQSSNTFDIAPPELPDSCSNEVILLKESFPEEFIQLNRTHSEFSYLNHEAILEKFYKNHKDKYDFLIVAPQETTFQSHYSFPKLQY